MGQSVKRKYTLKHLTGNNVNLIKVAVTLAVTTNLRCVQFSANRSIGMQTHNKQITYDDQLWIRPSFLRIQFTGTSAYPRLTEDLLNSRVIEWCTVGASK